MAESVKIIIKFRFRKQIKFTLYIFSTLHKFILNLLEKDTALFRAGPNQGMRIIVDENDGSRFTAVYENKIDIISSIL